MDGGSLANVVHQLGPIREDIMANIIYQVFFNEIYINEWNNVVLFYFSRVYENKRCCGDWLTSIMKEEFIEM